MTRTSSLYVGTVGHRRHLPRPHAFRYRLHMLYVDLDELSHLFDGRWLWSVERANWASWRRADYLGDPGVDLATAVRDRAATTLGRRPTGPIRMLTQLRYLGFCFNPVTFYYCFATDGVQLDALVAEITNTPWGERHAYVLDATTAERDTSGALCWRFPKTFHVSPFMAMDQDYVWRFTTPGSTLGVHMANEADGTPWFDAALDLRREELSAGSLARALLRHPFMTGKAIVAIYWQALRLWLRRVPFHPHPRHSARRNPAEPREGDRTR